MPDGDGGSATVTNAEKFFLIEATVRSGLGKGKTLIQSLSVDDPILRILKCHPYPGTLNLRLTHAIEMDGINYGRTRRGYVILAEGVLNENRIVIKWSQELPMQVQVISEINLRKVFNFIDGQKLYVKIPEKHIKRVGIRTFILATRQRIRHKSRKIRIFLFA